MMLRRRPLALVLTTALACTVGVLAQQPPQQKDKKQDEAQKKEIQGIVSTVDAVAGGQPAPNDFALAWVREDVLKAQGNKEYVPFTVSLDPAKAPGGTVAFYWRVVPKGAGREAAEKLARELAEFPQTCLRGDRQSAYEQFDLGFEDAMANEFRHGLNALQAETGAGAKKFAGGSGRHGAFGAGS